MQFAGILDARDRRSTLLVDAGDVLDGRPDKENCRRIAFMYGQLGYNLAAPGELDWIPDPAIRGTVKSWMPLTSMNVSFDEGATGPMGPEKVVLRRNGVTAALWSLSDPACFRGVAAAKGGAPRVEGGLPALARRLVALGDARDLDILVLHGGRDIARSIAEAAPALDVIVYGHERIERPMERVGGTILVSAWTATSRLGRLSLTIAGDGSVLEAENDLSLTGHPAAPARGASSPPPAAASAAQGAAPAPGLASAFAKEEASRIRPLPVALAGLADGVNPCAFAVLALLVALLAASGGSRARLLAVGAGYVAGTFAAYFAVGLGILGALRAIGLAVGSGAYRAVSAAVKLAAVAACAALCAVSIVDAVRAFRGRPGAMILKLPGAAGTKARELVRGYARRGVAGRATAAATVAGAVVLGGSTSLFELACTGQIYLPTIAYMTGKGEGGAIGFLLLYCACFVLPLAAVFALSVSGLSSRRLGRLLAAGMGWAKLAMAAVFALLAAATIGTLL